MLPEGFRWRDDTDGQTLLAGEEHAAYWVSLDNGRFRACLNCCHPMHLRHEFFETEAATIRYIEAWATRWQDRLLRRGDKREARAR